VKKQPFLRGKV